MILIAAFEESLANRPIDLLLHVAGVMYPRDSATLEKANFTELQKTFDVNTFGSLLLTQALLPSIELAERLGSIGDNLQVACTPTAVRRLRRICSSATSVSI